MDEAGGVVLVDVEGAAAVIVAVAMVAGQHQVKSVAALDGWVTSVVNVEPTSGHQTNSRLKVVQNVENAAVVYSAENAAGVAHLCCC